MSDNEENLMDDDNLNGIEAGVGGGGELRIDNGSSTPDSVFDNGKDNGDRASLNGSTGTRTSSLPSLSGILSSFSGRGDLWSTSESTSNAPTTAPPVSDGPDYAGQRKNLTLVAKIATRALIDPCLEKSLVIDEHYPPLVQFLFVLGNAS